MKATLKVIREDFPGGYYHVEGELVKDYHATDQSENVAWNGTLQLYVDSKGNYYLESHSGNSQHQPWAKKVPEILLECDLDEAQLWLF